jgi:hypothetical protein
MSGTPFDPAALEARLDKKFDRMFAQLTTITNRLNSHDRRMARIESDKPDAGKGTDGTDDHVGDDVSDVGEEEDTRGSERDRAWACPRCHAAGWQDGGPAAALPPPHTGRDAGEAPERAMLLLPGAVHQGPQVRR